MESHKSYIVLGLVIAFVLFFGIMAHADDAIHPIKITRNTPTTTTKATAEFQELISAVMDRALENGYLP
jgi:hypothetical protein